MQITLINNLYKHTKTGRCYITKNTETGVEKNLLLMNILAPASIRLHNFWQPKIFLNVSRSRLESVGTSFPSSAVHSILSLQSFCGGAGLRSLRSFPVGFGSGLNSGPFKAALFSRSFVQLGVFFESLFCQKRPFCSGSLLLISTFLSKLPL